MINNKELTDHGNYDIYNDQITIKLVTGDFQTQCQIGAYNFTMTKV